MCGWSARALRAVGVALLAVGALILILCVPFRLWLGLLGAALSALGALLLIL